MIEPLTYYCDRARHLVCIPYSIENLHRMADNLGIHRCWFHRGASYAHYDIPVRRITSIRARCTVVTPRDILAIVQGTYATPAGDAPSRTPEGGLTRRDS